ncbi:MAG: GntR family transcriptional regulator [Gemmatimonadota bacterium]
MHVKVEPLDIQIRRILLKRILAGEIAPGANLNEVRLARELGASRTPLRLALVRLEQEGFLVAEPNRGFFVAALSAEEAEELYPILATLEGLALRQGAPSEADLRELGRMNEELARLDPGEFETAAQANLRWHETLVRRCENVRLMGMIETLRQQVYRYEVSFFSPGRERLETSVELHRSILEALEGGDPDLACTRLDAHWMTDLDTLAPAFAAPESGAPATRGDAALPPPR